MDVQISGKGIDLGQALQTHVAEKMEAGVHKYFDRPADAHVVFTRDGPMIKCEANVHLASGVYLETEGDAGDAYGAFDEAMEKLEKRVRRYKRRLKNHHTHGKDIARAEAAHAYVLQSLPENEEASGAEDAPIIIAEDSTQLRFLSVSDAVMQLELTENPVLVFKNAAHGNTSVVYRRNDGNIGWIDTGSR
jgi:ribosome hibernation promoting factor